MLKLILRLGLSSVVWGAIGFLAAAQAQIVQDATLPTNSEVLTTGNDATIRGGTQVGGNLFHSFERFSVPTNGSAFFDNASTVQNIISRVTGTLPSSIDGTIRANGTANLFLINPNGILFGENARLNIGGSFVASTANAIGFGDTGVFSASNATAPSPLLTISPSALLFTQLSPGNITVNAAGTVQFDSGFPFSGLRVPNGKTLTLLGGNVNVDGGNLNAWGGRVEIGAISGLGTIRLNADGSLTVPEGVDRADVLFNRGAFVDVSFDQKGDIGVTARNVSFSDSELLAGIAPGLGTSSVQAGDIVVDAVGNIRISNTSKISNRIFAGGIGDGGNIRINTNTLNLSSGSEIIASTSGRGNSGNIILNVRDKLTLENEGTIILTRVQENVIANSGNLSITAGSLEVTDGARFGTDTSGEGNAGNININIQGQAIFDKGSAFSSVTEGGDGKTGNVWLSANSLTLSNGAQLSTGIFGKGNAGDVIIDVRDRVIFSGTTPVTFISTTSGEEYFSGVLSIVDRDAQGNSGEIRLLANSLLVNNRAQITASSFGKGNAGNVIIDIRDQATFDNGFALSTMELGGEGNSGNVQLSANSLSVGNGAQIAATTFSKGNAGSVIINVRGRMTLSGVSPNGRFPSGVRSRVGAEAEGKGGNVEISANSLFVSDGAQIRTDTSGKGDAGNITINVSDRMTLTGSSSDGEFSSSTGSGVQQSGEGKGGDINISANTLEVSDGAEVSARTFGKGNAGNITIDVRGHVSFNNAFARSLIEEGGDGKGGNVRILANSLEMTNGAEFDSGVFSKGEAGSILLGKDDRPITSILISGVSSQGFSSGLFTDTSSNLPAGDIQIIANQFRLHNGAVVNAQTFAGGNSGNINIRANTVEILGGSQILSTTEGSGSAQNITLKANQLLISGSDSTYNQRRAQFPKRIIDPISPESGIYTRSTATENAGSAGNIFLTVPRIQLANQARIDTQSAAIDGGNITIASDLLLLRNNSQISATAGTAQAGGNGGNININTRFLVAKPQENSDITANAFQGNGGRVNINTQGIYGIQPRQSPTVFSDITASSQFGISGNVALNTPDVDPSRGTIELPATVLDRSNQIAQTCAPKKVIASSFVRSGRGSLPPSPLDTLQGEPNSPQLATVEANSNSENHSDRIASLPTPSPIIEAQGWVKDAQGNIALVANPNTATAYPQTLGSCH